MDMVQEQWGAYTAAMREAGRDPLAMDQPMLMQTYVGETAEQAVRDAEPHAMWYHELLQKVLPGAPGKEVKPGYELYDKVRQAHAEVTYDDLVDWGSAFGDPEQVAERVVTYAKDAGVNHWMAEMRFGGLSHAQAMGSMELFSKEVMPRVRKALADTTQTA